MPCSAHAGDLDCALGSCYGRGLDNKAFPWTVPAPSEQRAQMTLPQAASEAQLVTGAFFSSVWELLLRNCWSLCWWEETVMALLPGICLLRSGNLVWLSGAVCREGPLDQGREEVVTVMLWVASGECDLLSRFLAAGGFQPVTEEAPTAGVPAGDAGLRAGWCRRSRPTAVRGGCPGLLLWLSRTRSPHTLSPGGSALTGEWLV